MRIRLLATLLLAATVAAPAIAQAAECTSNSFRPTFVRHNINSPQVFYVEPSGGFTAMGSPQQAQDTCIQRGVRQRISGRDCTSRNWGDFGCGCNITPARNSTCANFQRFLGVR
ncbi:hypothetical protein [Roseospirillum parvum]|uniref:DUF4189 domain-containing protein n=1 Tax=Roseospirillum parvum TaxID=83401 RepID=A0A1G8CMX0_9PROT|nr:hypothetical protein [Roseospirillum parvum]SDH46795.1 hypothetical protein SAMN05421742_10749 [Roseospirillum parvum]